MQAHDITFPSTIGTVVRGLREYVTPIEGQTPGPNVIPGPDLIILGFTVQPKLPEKKTTRMITVRDDGGTTRNGVLRRRHGFNIWADTPTVAENAAITVANAARSVFKALDVSGPLEVTDGTDDAVVIDGKTLIHYFVSAVIPVRAQNL